MLDGLPEQVEIAGQMVPISSDFRTGILFEEVLQDSGLDDLEKLQTALHLYFPGVVFDSDVLDEALGKLVWFYRCGADPAETPSETSGAADEAPRLFWLTAWTWRGTPSTGGSSEPSLNRSLKTRSWSKSSATAR